MLKFSANLTMMFTHLPFIERFEAAANAGFKAVEFWFPYAHTPEEIKAALDANGLSCVLFNMPPGDFDAGERGIACLPGRQVEFMDSVSLAIEYASIIGTPRLHAMAGRMPDGADRAKYEAVYLENLRYAAAEIGKYGFKLMLETVNTRDTPGYFLNYLSDAEKIRQDIGSDNVKLQLDIYHVQVIQGDITMNLRKHFAQIDHIQFAGVPDRAEPDVGELNYPYIFRQLEELGYDGWLGCEYRPTTGTMEGLGWIKPWLVD
ncbi:2-oxo-tetronate isomerase [Pusillimonas sp. ANT_WB101]|uniref:2-oxo-tetronate isomerase n=1 Tax=Pusillimonas sp. ANT_WB101 TaxID=2597356 RepID=UPI0011EE14C3|nr:2-oxo-tetronate isomerase [Pusillimonas sp. ANT_WB101]KAA0910522.1 hydroxypyruvate isomerase family protein [Pusillimonas sp. ANT_WB101]